MAAREGSLVGGTVVSRQIERLRKRAENERRRADALAERVERQSAAVAALADAVRLLAANPEERHEGAPEPRELVDLLAEAAALGDDPSGRSRPSQDAPNGAAGLTRREREVLVLAERGMSNREIGESLFISENTVRKHLKGANRALGTRKKAEAVRAARHLGVL